MVMGLILIFIVCFFDNRGAVWSYSPIDPMTDHHEARRIFISYHLRLWPNSNSGGGAHSCEPFNTRAGGSRCFYSY